MLSAMRASSPLRDVGLRGVGASLQRGEQRRGWRALDAFLKREVLPYAADAWYRPDTIKIGYEISFNRYFYKPQLMRTLDEIRADMLI